jgi:hypothetical protein
MKNWGAALGVVLADAPAVPVGVRNWQSGPILNRNTFYCGLAVSVTWSILKVLFIVESSTNIDETFGVVVEQIGKPKETRKVFKRNRKFCSFLLVLSFKGFEFLHYIESSTTDFILSLELERRVRSQERGGSAS